MYNDIQWAWYTVESRLRGGGGSVLRISGDRDERMGDKVKTQKIPRASIKTPKNPMPIFQAIKISRKR